MFTTIISWLLNKLTPILIVALAAVSIFAGVKYFEAERLSKQVATLEVQLGAQSNAIAQQKSDLAVCSKATEDLQAAQAKASVAASQALDVANKKAAGNVNYAKQLVKTVPVGNSDYASVKNLMDKLVDRRNGVQQ